MGGILPPATASASALFQMKLLLVFELFLGGLLVMFMDEIVSKWGFGSGISLFIAAGISKEIFIKLFSFTDTAGNMFWESTFQGPVVGILWSTFSSLTTGDGQGALLGIITIAATLIVFAIAVYSQAMKVEIPLSFGRVRGHGIRWPLQFIYTSNMPVILVVSLFATLQLWVRLLQNWTGGNVLPILGGYTGGNIPVGLMAVLQGPNLVNTIVVSGGQWAIVGPSLLNGLIYILLMVGGSVTVF